jgi:hypothetical protein
MAAFSINANKAGVAKTGISPEPKVMAVFSSLTTVALVCANPFSIIMLTCFFICKNTKKKPQRPILLKKTGLSLKLFPRTGLSAYLCCNKQG